MSIVGSSGFSRICAFGGTIVALALGAGIVAAHDLPGSTEFVVSLPEDYHMGGITFIDFIGLEIGSQILHATLNVTWNADPNMPASDLGMAFFIEIEGELIHWAVTGADLGWDDGPGPFTGTIDTDELNGLATGLAQTVIVHFELSNASGMGGIWGQFQDSTFSLELGATTPSGVPDLRVQKAPTDDTRLRLTFDTTTCLGNDGNHLVYGFGSQLPSAPGGTLLVDGSRCLVASPYAWVDVPDPSIDPSDLLWFLALANDGGTIEGSWGLDGFDSERQGPGPGGSSGVCGISAKNTANACGQ